MTGPCDPNAPHVEPPRDPAAMLALVEQVARVGHWRVDAADWAVTWSPEVFRIHGMTPTDSGPDIQAAIACFHPEDRPRVERFVNDAVEFGAPFEFTLRLQRPDGEIRHVLSRGHCEFAACGGVSAVFGVLLDVTEQKRAEAAAEQARALAEAASEAKSEFLASMSHEIRTPLNGILGFADLLLEQEGLDSDHRRLAERIQSAGAALRTVVDDILDFSEIESGKVSLEPRRFELAMLVDDAVSIVSGLAARKGLELAVILDDRAPRALIGDQDRLRQVLLNLLNNAVKFTPSGSVTLKVTCPAVEPGSAVIRFAVIDTGIGIPADKRDRLFQRFSQADGSITREFGGTGLGLAISKSLVMMMGGEIGVDSSAGAGSTFWFTVRLAIDNAPAIVAKTPTFTVDPDSRGRILLVEDVAINQELARAVLERAGHEVDVVGDGVAAIAAVQARTYDLVLMDVQMPGMDGMTATRHIRDLEGVARDLPIIAMTANVLPTQVAQFRAVGMDDHIGKPFRQDALYAIVTRWIGGRNAGPPSLNELSAASVLDPTFYASMREAVGADVMGALLGDLAVHLLEHFGETSLSVDDPRELATAAHAVVSAAGMLGFAELSAACADLEAASLQGREIAALLQRVRTARRRALAEIEKLRDAA